MADELTAALREGATNVYAAHGICSVDDVPPIGKLPAGVTIQQFWHLGVPQVEGWHHLYIPPPQRPKLDRPEVNILLQEMMGIRRMSRQQLASLAQRVMQLQTSLGSGDGGFAAATLLARMQQALSEPTNFPGLLTNAELRMAYNEGKGLASMMGVATDLDSGATTVVVGSGTAAAAAPKQWIDKVAESLKKNWAGRAAQATAAAPKQWSGVKKAGVGGASWLWAKFMLGRGVKEQNAAAQSFRDEMIRRGLPAP